MYKKPLLSFPPSEQPWFCFIILVSPIIDIRVAEPESINSTAPIITSSDWLRHDVKLARLCTAPIYSLRLRK